MKILFLAPRLPYPLDTGAKIRTFNLIKEAARKHHVSLLCFSFSPNDAVFKNEIEGFGVKISLVEGISDKRTIKSAWDLFFSSTPLSVAKYRILNMVYDFKKLIIKEKFDLIHYDHLLMGQYVEYAHGIPAVVDEHNVETIIYERCADVEKNFIKRNIFKSQAKKMAALESSLVNKFSACLTVSEHDKMNLYKLSGGSARIAVIPNGVDTEYFRPQKQKLTRASDENIIFTGSMDWLPNEDAVEYFCTEIMPILWRTKPHVKLFVVGKNPSASVRKLSGQEERIVVTGTVDDVRPYINNAMVFVVPLRIGGGSRLKILEAMAMGKAVVSTTIGAEGIQYTDQKNLILADDPDRFAKTVLELLDNPERREELGEEGRRLVEEVYDWRKIGEGLNKVYEEVMTLYPASSQRGEGKEPVG